MSNPTKLLLRNICQRAIESATREFLDRGYTAEVRTVDQDIQVRLTKDDAEPEYFVVSVT